MHSLYNTERPQIDSEYKLVDPERLKHDLRTSRTTPSSSFNQNYTHTFPHLCQTYPENIENMIELPVSHSLKQSDQQNKSSSEQIDKKFLTENLKQIEDVMYGEVFRQKNTVKEDNSLGSSQYAKSDEKGSKLEASRFNQNEQIKVFNKHYDREADQLVKNYEKLKIQRQKHREAGYFKNKQRSVQEIQLAELFEKYKSREAPIKNNQELIEGKVEYVKNTDHQVLKQQSIKKQQQIIQQIKQSSYLNSKPLKHVDDTAVKHLQVEEQAAVTNKECMLCKASKLSHKINTEITIIKPQKSPQTHYGKQEQWQIENNPTQTQQRVSRINTSPNKNKLRYLSSEDKRQYNRKNSVEPDQTLFEAGKLKKQYLRDVEARNRQKQQLTNSQIPTLNIELKASTQKISQSLASSKHRTPRKKIFSGNQVMAGAYIKIESDEKELHMYQSQKTKAVLQGNRSTSKSTTPQTYKKIFNSRKQKQSRHVLSPYKNKTISRQLDFNHYRQELISSRVKIFKSKEKEQKSSSLRTKSLIPGLRLLQMSAEVRKWYEDNRKEIIFQAERICSYDLINRYMTQQQISSRLFSMATGMVQPRRWVLLMVDEVYARLKDRYLPQ